MGTDGAIDMLHPGPVRLVRRGARKDVVALVPMRTRVGIREVQPWEIPQVGTLNSLGAFHAYHAFEDGLWLRVEGTRFGKAATGPLAGNFAAFLEDRMPAAEYAGTDYVRALAGSPLLGPLCREVRALDRPDVVDDAREVLDDAREQAAAAARRWVSERVVSAAGLVYLRAPNPMVLLGEPGNVESLQRCLVDPFPAYWRTARFRKPEFRFPSLELQGFPVRIDRIADMQAAVAPLGLIHDAGRQGGLVAGQAAGIPFGLLDDDDLALMANVLPGYALAEVARLVREPEDGAEPGALAAARAALAPLEVRGTVGIHDADGAEDVIARVAAVARAAPGLRFQAIALWADAVALPRLRARNAVQAPSEDEDALSGLSH